MVWRKLTSCEALIHRGSILRTQAQSPFEHWVDFMLMDDWQSPSSFSLWICSGTKAGLPLVRIPKEATDQRADAVQSTWLIENWQAWVHADSNPDQVYVRSSYAVPEDWQQKA